MLANIVKFADDTKLEGTGQRELESQQIQSDFNKMVDWSGKWQMKFNVSKCKIEHLGHHILMHEYSMSRKKLTPVIEARVLGVIIGNDFKSSKQCNNAEKNAGKC